jgi:hypothetical protein
MGWAALESAFAGQVAGGLADSGKATPSLGLDRSAGAESGTPGIGKTRRTDKAVDAVEDLEASTKMKKLIRHMVTTSRAIEPETKKRQPPRVGAEDLNEAPAGVLENLGG